MGGPIAKHPANTIAAVYERAAGMANLIGVKSATDDNTSMCKPN